MPVGRSPIVLTSNIRSSTGLDLESAVTRGEAVAVVSVLGVMKIDPCGASVGDNGEFFLGFASQTRSVGEKVRVTTARGTTIEPLVEDGEDLVPGGKVWLSKTKGRVTQTPPTGGGVFLIEVGYATSTTHMVMVTDPRIQVP